MTEGKRPGIAGRAYFTNRRLPSQSIGLGRIFRGICRTAAPATRIVNGESSVVNRIFPHSEYLCQRGEFTPGTVVRKQQIWPKCRPATYRERFRECQNPTFVVTVRIDWERVSRHLAIARRFLFRSFKRCGNVPSRLSGIAASGFLVIRCRKQISSSGISLRRQKSCLGRVGKKDPGGTEEGFGRWSKIQALFRARAHRNPSARPF
jgi:hypothetical protein